MDLRKRGKSSPSGRNNWKTSFRGGSRRGEVAGRDMTVMCSVTTDLEAVWSFIHQRPSLLKKLTEPLSSPPTPTPTSFLHTLFNLSQGIQGHNSVSLHCRSRSPHGVLEQSENWFAILTFFWLLFSWTLASICLQDKQTNKKHSLSQEKQVPACEVAALCACLIFVINPDVLKQNTLSSRRRQPNAKQISRGCS